MYIIVFEKLMHFYFNLFSLNVYIYNTSADRRHDVNYEKHMALLCASNITYNLLKNK